MNGWLLHGLCLAFTLGLPLHAQELGGGILDQELRTNGKTTLQAVEPEREILQRVSAVIQEGRDPVANGTVMTGDGYILTKASELKKGAKLSVRIDRTLYEEVEMVAEDPETDLALLKIPAQGLETPVWDFEKPGRGTLVVANGATTRTNRRASLGIVSATARAIPADRGNAVLGVAFSSGESLAVARVYPGFSADRAGVKPGDVLMSLNGRKLAFPQDIGAILKGLNPGESMELELMREGKRVVLGGTLTAAPPSRNDRMSGRFNERRSGFPECLQHDVPLSIYNSGGPLLTLEGKAIGINIARANRAESFALTAETVQKAFLRLKKQRR